MTTLCNRPRPSPPHRLPSDAEQQARDGAGGRGLGDLRELPAEARPMPHAPDLPGGGQDLADLRRPDPHDQGPGA